MALSVSERQAKRLGIALGEEFGCEVSLPLYIRPRAGTSFCGCRRCTEIRTMGTPSRQPFQVGDVFFLFQRVSQLAA